jgi:hypothetical protein
MLAQISKCSGCGRGIFSLIAFSRVLCMILVCHQNQRNFSSRSRCFTVKAHLYRHFFFTTFGNPAPCQFRCVRKWPTLSDTISKFSAENVKVLFSPWTNFTVYRSDTVNKCMDGIANGNTCLLKVPIKCRPLNSMEAAMSILVELCCTLFDFLHWNFFPRSRVPYSLSRFRRIFSLCG